MLIGFAKDIHKLKRSKNKPLILGGFHIKDSNYSISSHSDGDIIFHSIADAIYSICSDKDIGERFSDKDISNKNLNSATILKNALDLFFITFKKEIKQINLTIICNKIFLQKYKKEIINSIKLYLPNTFISLKGKRFEKRSKMIECYCLII